ncbi:hypothetical protein FFLO_03309 [Filobasidium floriforme]|uniref:GST C-terminal domain-containing protein n=1 Tax=Filobasidium floriforme TaxID=5210 RepID=A0A8K0JKX9_9TREE|nr:hypothetical protein FFLO_03309 [Filobasidium floriforme]
MSTSNSTSNSNSTDFKPNWASEDGSFKRQVSSFRDSIEKGGKFEPEKGRYHLYVCNACPWAHRTLIVRKLKGLEDFFDVSYVHPHMLSNGWKFSIPGGKVPSEDFPQATEDKLFGSKYMKEIYFKADPEYNARYTVPVIWDTKHNTIVSNESSEIIRFLNTAFNDQLPKEKAELDLYPDELKKEIDDLNEWVYPSINNGVYRSGFATTQKAYEEAVTELFGALDRVEGILKDGREYLIGGKLTEADVRLYTTIVRFDIVYHGHFKCNLGSIRHDYPALNRWLKNLYWNNAAFKDTTDFETSKEHYYFSHKQINGSQVVPIGPKYPVEPL